MAQAIKFNNAEEILLNTVIVKVRDGLYNITSTEENDGFDLSGKVIVRSTQLENTRRVVAKIGDKEFTGKMVRRLEKAIINRLEIIANGPKSKGGKKKVVASESEVADLMELI